MGMKFVSDETMQKIASRESLLEQYGLAYTDYKLGRSQGDESRVHQAQRELIHIEKMALTVWGDDFWADLRHSVGLGKKEEHEEDNTEKIEKNVFFCMEYTLDHVTQENGKWFAEIRKYNAKGFTREHTGELWGWNGMTYSSLKCMLLEYYNIRIPDIRELQFKRTMCGKIYLLQTEKHLERPE